MIPDITPSMLEAWDLFLSEVISQDDLKNRLLRVRPEPAPRILIGEGYNWLIAGTLGDQASYEGFKFDLKSAKKFGVLDLGKGLDLEVPVSWRHDKFVLVGRVDGIDKRNDIHEFKSSDKVKSYLDYYNSIQWKCYSMMLDSKVVYSYIRYSLKSNLVTTVGVERFDFMGGKATRNNVIGSAIEMLHYAEMMQWEIRGAGEKEFSVGV